MLETNEIDLTSAHSEAKLPSPSLPGPLLTVVVPTLNEERNIVVLVEKLRIVLQDIHWEAVFVDDDSRDSTRAAAGESARIDRRVRLVHRIDRRGLASTCTFSFFGSA
jgi:dolichol-phosphate mannosyltransferase